MIPRRFRNLPLKQKLVGLSLLTTGIALLLTCGAFIVRENITFRRDMARDLTSTAGVIGYNSGSALSFRDPDSASETLASLYALPHVIRGAVFDENGQVFATYHRDPERIYPWPALAAINAAHAQDGPRQESRSIEVFHPIFLGGEFAGTIYLESELDQLLARYRTYLAISASVLVAAMLVAWLIAHRLQRIISGPVEDLAVITARVAGEKNYTLRAEKTGEDEIGRLVDGFNHMLAQIEARDAELHAAQLDLERRVEERTRSLENARLEMAREKNRFQFIFDSLPVGVSWRRLDDDDSAIFNPAHVAITGVTLEAAKDRTAFQKVTHPDDRLRQQPLAERFSRGEIDEFSLEKRFIHPDGRIVWAVLMARMATDPETGARQTLTTLVDITDLKRAQEETARERTRFKFIFDSLSVGVAWMIRHQSHTRVANASFARISGVPTEHCQEMTRYAALTHPDDRPAQTEFARRMNNGEINQYSLEKRYLRPDGSVAWAVLTVRLLSSESGAEIQELATLVDINERKQAEAELAVINRQLLETSRQAGMAEVATGVLHNVGNVLNSVNVSATLVSDQIRRSKAPNIAKLRDLFIQNKNDLGRYLTADPKGRLIPDYLSTLADAVAAEHASIQSELDALHKNIGHIKDIVSMQQSYAKTSGVVETLSVPDLIEDALRMNAGSLARHDVQVAREYDGRPVITVEKNKVLQILVNFIRNAKYACDEAGRTDKLITMRIRTEDTGVAVSVIDNGVGIAPENLVRIFNHGFTTRKHGHGFGLHSGALAAKELGGSLSAHSDGPGKGAVFTLRLPLSPPSDPS